MAPSQNSLSSLIPPFSSPSPLWKHSVFIFYGQTFEFCCPAPGSLPSPLSGPQLPSSWPLVLSPVSSLVSYIVDSLFSLPGPAPQPHGPCPSPTLCGSFIFAKTNLLIKHFVVFYFMELLCVRCMQLFLPFQFSGFPWPQAEAQLGVGEGSAVTSVAQARAPQCPWHAPSGTPRLRGLLLWTGRRAWPQGEGAGAGSRLASSTQELRSPRRHPGRWGRGLEGPAPSRCLRRADTATPCSVPPLPARPRGLGGERK